MNVLTVAATALVTSFTLGAIVRALGYQPDFGRLWRYRITVVWLVILFGLELLMLAFDYWAPLSDRHVWIPLALFALHTAQAWNPRYWALRSESVPDRYPYTPSRQDLHLIWLALALPGTALLAVFAVLIAHAFTAHS